MTMVVVAAMMVAMVIRVIGVVVVTMGGVPAPHEAVLGIHDGHPVHAVLQHHHRAVLRGRRAGHRDGRRGHVVLHALLQRPVPLLYLHDVLVGAGRGEAGEGRKRCKYILLADPAHGCSVLLSLRAMDVP